MKSPTRGMTVVVHQDGALDSRRWHVSGWLLTTSVAVTGVLVLGLVIVLALYVPIVRAAATVPGLRRDIARLEADNAKVRELATALDEAEARYHQLRGMLGADRLPDPVSFNATLPVAPAVTARHSAARSTVGQGPSIPARWPLDIDGYITRGQIGSGTQREAHPGLDVAVPIGSVVRAAGGGSVLDAGSDPEYGFFVLVRHPDDFRTMYGHLSRITTGEGEYVDAGEVIGLSGNSGRSSAPHLHFEVRQGDQSLNPLDFVREGVQ